MRTIDNVTLLIDLLETRNGARLLVRRQLTPKFECLRSKHFFETLFNIWSVVVWIVFVGEVLVVVENLLNLFRIHHRIIIGREPHSSVGAFCLVILSIFLVDVRVIDLMLLLLKLHLILQSYYFLHILYIYFSNF